MSPQASTHVISTPVVKLAGADLKPEVADLLVEVLVDDHRWLPDAVELRFRDDGLTVVDKGGFEVGKPLKVGVNQGGVKDLAEVEITAVEMLYDAGGTWTLVRGYDASHRLQRGRKTQSFLKQSVGAIFRKVVQGAGAQVGSVANGPTLEEVIQPNLSDWEFLQRLAGDFGLEVTVDRGKVGLSEPVAASGSPALTLTLGDDILAMRVAVSAAEAVSKVQVRAWDPKQKKAVVGTAPASTTVAQIGATSDPKQLASKFGSRVLTVTDVPHVVEQGQLATMAKGFADQVGATFVDLDVSIEGTPVATSGAVVELKNVGKPFAGKYVITAARHVIGPEGYQTSLSVSGRRDSSLHGLTAAGGAPGGLVAGLVPAIVTNTKDPDKKGRVKVKLPWLDEAIETDWARTVQMGGGKGGGMVIPEVNDEVLVGFDHGRLECPYVIGGLYNGKDSPGTGDDADIDDSSGAVARRSFADREGNRIELIKASNGNNGIRLTTGDKKFSMYFDGKNQTIKIDSGGKVEVTTKTDLSLVAQGNVSIESKGNLTLKATGNLKAEATGNVDVKATGNLVADGMTAALKGKTKAEVAAATGPVTVSGLIAELKGSTATTISGAIVKIN